ncbi:MAG: YebC/PmpR family DNA-binding transcriptional regulator [bacterium]|nr:YebC/PmpR family DNA-binding transcriptional regulator [bacterium]
MSGHSKWSKVKHQKATTDVVKAQAFTKAGRAIAVAIKEGGKIANPDLNFHLRLAIEKARSVNMPKETIDRAIARASEEEGSGLAVLLYEGYAKGGVAYLVEVATDNPNRSVSLVKNVFERHEGSLAGPGSVAYLFERVGVVNVASAPNLSLDHVIDQALASGADDVKEYPGGFEIVTRPHLLFAVKDSIERAGLPVHEARLVMRPTAPRVLDHAAEQGIEELTHDLMALDDVQRVYSNTL